MNTLVRYGLIGGAAVSVLMFAPFFAFGTRPDWMRISEVVGYSSMLLCMSVTWFAMRRERARSGALTFGRALAVGIGVSGVAALLFGGATWLFYLVLGQPLIDGQVEYYALQIRTGGGSDAEIARRLTELESMRPMLSNRPLMAAVMAATVFLIGAAESLAGAYWITRRAARERTA
jgi:hypothetical protein